MSFTEAQKLEFSEQDTATKLVLPTMHKRFDFPEATSSDYTEQRFIPRRGTTPGRYDGMYSYGGYPIAILEVKSYSHLVLTHEDFSQAREYAISPKFDPPLPYLIISNGRQYKFYARIEDLDVDDKPKYVPVSQRFWDEIKDKNQGEEVQFIDIDQLVRKFIRFQRDIFNDMHGFLYELSSDNYHLERLSDLQSTALKKIIETREKYVRKTEGSGRQKEKRQIQYALNGVALHFVVKILFIKIIEDLSDSAGLPKVLKRLFPRPEFDHVGGIFAYRILDKLNEKQKFKILRYLTKNLGDLNKLLAKLTWEDIFRYGFKIYSRRFGELISAKYYDSFYPSNETLETIRNELIKIDLGYILSNGTTRNFIGELYMKLIDESLKNALGTVYTPDDTVDFMVKLAKLELDGFVGKKILEPACGSGHFIKKIYREYIDEVVSNQQATRQTPDILAAHKDALHHIFGRDIDPFAVQLTLLALFLEQLRDNIAVEDMTTRGRHWLPDESIDCVDSIDPDTFRGQTSMGFVRTQQMRGGQGGHITRSHSKTINPNLIIGNPPYGIKVSNDIKDVYNLGSRDSYGVFIDNSIRRLPDGGYLIFIVSSSFLTLESHKIIRKQIFEHCKIKRIFKLHRSTFPGIDVFPGLSKFRNATKKMIVIKTSTIFVISGNFIRQGIGKS